MSVRFTVVPPAFGAPRASRFSLLQRDGFNHPDPAIAVQASRRELRDELEYLVGEAAYVQLFDRSRQRKKMANDADRLRKYLARFGLEWSDLKERAR
jgi:hypothetical protein